MRLIDADALLCALALEPMENRTYWRANEIVLDQPTAYDIDEKVDKLEELIEENVGYLRATPEASEYIKAIRDAIEIVRAGMKELKPCPFCGGEPLLEPYEVRKGYEASIQCNSCLAGMSTITYDDEKTALKEVIEAWNRRAGEQK